MHEVSIFKTVKAKQCIFNNVGFKINTLTFHKTQTRSYNQEHVLASLKKKNLMPYLPDSTNYSILAKQTSKHFLNIQ